jgi:hypothetical protein
MPDTESTEDTRDTRSIHASIREHRRDLIASLGELEALVRAKLDVRMRLRHAAERGMIRAGQMLERVVDRARARPVPFIVLGGMLVVLLFRRRG